MSVCPHTRITMLTTKDVLYCSDLLDQTLVLNKRINQENTLLASPEVKKSFNNVNKKLKEQYRALVQILKKEEQNAKK